MKRVPLTTDKIEAVRLLTEQAGFDQSKCYGYVPDLDDTLSEVFRRLPDHANPHLVFRPSDRLPGATVRNHAPKVVRPVLAPDHRNGTPTGFPEQPVGSEESPPFNTLELAGGYMAQIGLAPVTLLSTGDRVVSDFSSRYARLLHGYDLDLRRVLEDARKIDGTAVVLCDDVWPLNFSHWLLDELPRLAFLGERRDVSVVITAPAAGLRYDMLLQWGFAPERIVPVADFSAVRADRLILASNMPDLGHPAFKGAAWALDSLRRTLAPALNTPRRKIYVSRADADGRYLLGEDALMDVLAPLGYERTTLRLRPVAEQAALFNSASHIVGLHGAGFANFAFARPGTQIVELFPVGYGTPAYYVIAAAVGCRYATYVARGEVRVQQKRDQMYDARLDLDHFASVCRDILCQPASSDT